MPYNLTARKSAGTGVDMSIGLNTASFSDYSPFYHLDQAIEDNATEFAALLIDFFEDKCPQLSPGDLDDWQLTKPSPDTVLAED